MAWETRRLSDLAFLQVLVSAIGLLFVAMALKHAAAANLLTEKVSIEARRPWVTITVTKATVHIGDRDSDYVTVDFCLKNIGHHPATNITVEGKDFRESAMTVYLSVPGDMIKEHRSMVDHHAIGYALFPGDEMPLGRIYSLKKVPQGGDAYLGGFVGYRHSLSDCEHFTPWAVELRYNTAAAVGSETKVSVSPFYVTTRPT